MFLVQEELHLRGQAEHLNASGAFDGGAGAGDGNGRRLLRAHDETALDSLGGDMAENAEVVKENTGETQLTFFETMPDPVKEKLQSLDLMNTTPSEALKILEDLKKHL